MHAIFIQVNIANALFCLCNTFSFNLPMLLFNSKEIAYRIDILFLYYVDCIVVDLLNDDKGCVFLFLNDHAIGDFF